MDKAIAFGTITKDRLGLFHARLVVYEPNVCVYKAKARKRMKDAIDECNDVADRLGWRVEIWRKP